MMPKKTVNKLIEGVIKEGIEFNKEFDQRLKEMRERKQNFLKREFKFLDKNNKQ